MPSRPPLLTAAAGIIVALALGGAGPGCALRNGSSSVAPEPAAECPELKCSPCSNGYLANAAGCMTCMCKPPQCEPANCVIDCILARDANGCEICRCAEGPNGPP